MVRAVVIQHDILQSTGPIDDSEESKHNEMVLVVVIQHDILQSTGPIDDSGESTMRWSELLLFNTIFNKARYRSMTVEKAQWDGQGCCYSTRSFKSTGPIDDSEESTMGWSWLLLFNTIFNKALDRSMTVKKPQ